MIRINLLNNVDAPNTVINSTGMTRTGDLGEEQEKRLGLAKLLLLIIPLVAMSYYSGQIVKTKKKTLSKARIQLREFKKVNEQQGILGEEIQNIRDEEEMFRARIKVIDGLSRNRSLVIQAIDAVQTLIPERIWLTRLQVQKSSVEIEGYSVSDLELSSFIQSLQDSRFFVDVNLRDSSEAKLERGNFKKFEVIFAIREI